MPEDPSSSSSTAETNARQRLANRYPTPFQKSIVWSGLAALAIVIIATTAVGGIYLTSMVLGFLQPLLVPVAVAGILAYLLEPIILWLIKRGVSRRKAIYGVYIGFNLFAILLAILVLRPAITQAKNFGETYLTQLKEPQLTEFRESHLPEGVPATDSNSESRLGILIECRLRDLDNWVTDKFGHVQFFQQFKKDDKSWDLNLILGEATELAADERLQSGIAWFFNRGGGWAISFFGYLFGLFLVPLYLFFFLRESTYISQNWTKYIPLRKSHLKDEVVATLGEINGYLIAYFRGQMLVSMIDGALVAIGLSILGLPYALLLGVFLAILGLIPYIGNLLVMIPAALISVVHFSNPDVRFGGGEIWIYPLIVIGIFVLLQQINGFVTAPKIVGDSVGLHPLTVIFSMLFWAFLLGGLLGTLLAVPLTASLKVLLRRYIWEWRNTDGTPDSSLAKSNPPPDATSEASA